MAGGVLDVYFNVGPRHFLILNTDWYSFLVPYRTHNPLALLLFVLVRFVLPLPVCIFNATASGEIVDPNYVVDAVTGKLTFKRLGTGKRKGSTTVKVGADKAPKPKPAPKTRPPPKPRMPRKKKKAKLKPERPRKKFVGPETVVGFRDPMTGDKVDDLAISPYGHIMSYEVRWLVVVVVVAVVVVVGGGFVVVVVSWLWLWWLFLLGSLLLGLVVGLTVVNVCLVVVRLLLLFFSLGSKSCNLRSKKETRRKGT